MKPTTVKWTKAVMRESFLGFTRGTKVHVRLAVTKRPLAVGPVYILFDGHLALKVVAELKVLFRTEGMEPDSLRITKLYRRYLANNPVANRYTEQEYLYRDTD